MLKQVLSMFWGIEFVCSSIGRKIKIHPMKTLLCLLLSIVGASAVNTNRVGEFVAYAVASRCAAGYDFDTTQIFLRVGTDSSVLAVLAVQGNVIETGTNRMSRFGRVRGRTQQGFSFSVVISRNRVRGIFTGVCAGRISGTRRSWSS